MKKLITLSALLAISAVAQANSYKIDLNTTDTGLCESRVAAVADALVNQPLSVEMDQDQFLEQLGDGEGSPTVFSPGECNADLTSTGSADITLTTIQVAGSCVDAGTSDSRLAGAVYTNSYDGYKSCTIDIVRLK